MVERIITIKDDQGKEHKVNCPIPPYSEEEHQMLMRLNAVDVQRVAMMCAFKIFDAIHAGQVISSGAQYRNGDSYHEFYKKACLEALEPFTKDGKLMRF